MKFLKLNARKVTEKEVRELFPVSNHTVYVNHAAVSPYSNWVKQEMNNYISQRWDNQVEDFICNKNNVIFCVDGIQGVGACKLDVRKCQIDFLSNVGHKWLMSPQGSGFIYITDKGN